MLYDLIIIGAGPAGITAAVYAARKGMKLLIITGDIGGQTALTADIENYIGYQFISGPELTAKFEEHIKKYEINIAESEKVTGISRKGSLVKVTTEKASYESRTAIIATGAHWRELKVPGETEYKNKGLTYCATCDGPLFAGKDVAIIGGGNSGLQAAIQMESIAKRVYLIERGPDITGDSIIREKIAGKDKVAILTDTKVTAILGEKMVTGIQISSGGKEKTLSVQGVFVEIGLVPNSGFNSELDKNKRNEIKISPENETSVPGVFAAGDVTDVSEKQIIIAAGEGAKAALSAFKYLVRQK